RLALLVAPAQYLASGCPRLWSTPTLRTVLPYSSRGLQRACADAESARNRRADSTHAVISDKTTQCRRALKQLHSERLANYPFGNHFAKSARSIEQSIVACPFLRSLNEPENVFGSLSEVARCANATGSTQPVQCYLKRGRCTRWRLGQLEQRPWPIRLPRCRIRQNQGQGSYAAGNVGANFPPSRVEYLVALAPALLLISISLDRWRPAHSARNSYDAHSRQTHRARSHRDQPHAPGFRFGRDT